MSGYQGRSDYFDVVLHNFTVANTGFSKLVITNGFIRLIQGGEVMQQQGIVLEDMRFTLQLAEQYAAYPPVMEGVYDVSRMLKQGETFSESLALKPGEAALSTDYYMTSRGIPDSVEIEFVLDCEDGQRFRTSKAIAVRAFKSANEYVFPVSGADWFVRGYPGIRGHHRWTSFTEFALDITRVDSGGNWHSGSGSRWTDWYAYGEDVLAVADGRVVKVYDQHNPDISRDWIQEGETPEEYSQRNNARLMAQLAETDSIYDVFGGNHVVIEHPGGEHSIYMHLAYGSITVKEGQQVSQRDVIAGVGGTGDGIDVHLHFQLTNGRDIGSRTLPVTFSNTRKNDVFTSVTPESWEPGYFILLDDP
jgi:murein DD-endopeptidase MepM/ murein hydrolase activator NlpD